MKLSPNSQLKMAHVLLLNLAVQSPHSLWTTYPIKIRSSERIIVPLTTNTENVNPSVTTPVKVRQILIDYIQLRLCSVKGTKELYNICQQIISDLSEIMTDEEKNQLKILS